MNLTLGRLLGAIISISVLAVGAFLVVRFTIAEVGNDPEEDLLLAENRTELSVCVEGAGGLDISDEHVERGRQALEGGLEGGSFVPSEYSQRTITVGCPPPSAHLGQALSKW